MDINRISKALYRVINESMSNGQFSELDEIIASAGLKVSSKTPSYYIKLYKKDVSGAAGWSSTTKEIAYSGVVGVNSRKRNSNIDTVSESIKKVFETLSIRIYKSYGTVNSYEYYTCYVYSVNERVCNEIRIFVRDNGNRGVTITKGISEKMYFPEADEMMAAPASKNISIDKVLEKYSTDKDINELLTSRVNPLAKLAGILNLNNYRKVSEATVSALIKKQPHGISLNGYPTSCYTGNIEKAEILKSGVFLRIYVQNDSTDITDFVKYNDFFKTGTYEYYKSRGRGRDDNFRSRYDTDQKLLILKSILIEGLYASAKSDKLPNKETVIQYLNNY